MESIWYHKTGCEYFTEESRLEESGLFQELKAKSLPDLHGACYHVTKGLKACVRYIWSSFNKTSYLYKTDIYSYYASIDPDTLLTSCIRKQCSVLIRLKAHLGRGNRSMPVALSILTDISKRWNGKEPCLPTRCHQRWEINLCLNYLEKKV